MNFLLVNFCSNCTMIHLKRPLWLGMMAPKPLAKSSCCKSSSYRILLRQYRGMSSSNLQMVLSFTVALPSFLHQKCWLWSHKWRILQYGIKHQSNKIESNSIDIFILTLTSDWLVCIWTFHCSIYDFWNEMVSHLIMILACLSLWNLLTFTVQHNVPVTKVPLVQH